MFLYPKFLKVFNFIHTFYKCSVRFMKLFVDNAGKFELFILLANVMVLL